MTEISTVPEPVTAVPLPGLRVRWDGSNEDAVRQVAGERWRGTMGPDAFIWGMAGRLVRVRPGMVVTCLWDPGDPQAGGIVIAADAAVAALQWKAAGG